MTFLTQMRINPARRGSTRLLQSPQAMHAAVLAGYPVEDPGRVLWRVDMASRHQVTLYVVGALEPDLTHLVEQLGWPTADTWRTTSYAPFLDGLMADQHWRFRLTANPVQTLAPTKGAKRGSVVPHVTAAQQEAWLRGRAASWGFEPLAAEQGGVLVTRRGREAFAKTEGGGEPRRRRVTIARGQFDGVLRISDADVMRQALVMGMGRAKAYGCGLMTLAPVVP